MAEAIILTGSMGGSMDGGSVASARPAAQDALALVHARLLRQADLQFGFAGFTPPQPPTWLKPLAQLLMALAPVIRWVFWIGLAIGAGTIVWFVARELLAARLPSWRRQPKAAAEPQWRPAAGRARTLLEDADRLAAEGRYGQAVRLILFRSIEDIDQRWPNQVGPALTSRDIAALVILPAAARGAFAGIAAVVERSLFAGRAVDADGYLACRQAYQAFALPEQA